MPDLANDPPPAPRKLSAELHALNARFGQEEVQLGELIDTLGARAYSLFLVLLALPFFTPISMMGIAMAIGPVAAYLGLRLALGLRPSLPEKLRARRLPPRFFGLLLRGAERMIRLLERCTRKRLALFVTDPWAQRGIGVGIMFAALLLIPPAPFSNVLPGASILFLAMGRLEEDGAMVLAGFVAILLSLAYFAALGFFGVEAFEHVYHWLAVHLHQAPPTP